MLKILNGLDAAVVRRLGILCVFLSIFSGRFSFGRLLGQTAIPSEFLEFRYWFGLLAAIACLLLAGMGERKLLRRPNWEIAAFLAFVVLFYGYYIINLTFVSDVEQPRLFYADALLVVATLPVILALFRSQADITWFARLAEGAGVLLFAAAALGIGSSELNGPGWAPLFGGPITFYRIEFLTFACALFLATNSSGAARAGHLAIAMLGLFCAFASLSKAATLGAFVVILVFFALLCSTRKYKQALLLVVLSTLVFGIFVSVKGSLLVARVGDVINLKANTEAEIGAMGALPSSAARGRSTAVQAKLYWVFEIEQALRTGRITRFKDLSKEQQERILAIVEINDWPPELKENIRNGLMKDVDKTGELKRLLPSIAHTIVLQDSGRMLLALNAWNLFKDNTWWGAGVGSYRFYDINRYTKEIETYTYPHNIFLEVAATMGMIGIGFFGLAVLAGAILLNQRQRDDVKWIFLCGYPLFIMMTSLYSGDLYDHRVFWFVTLMILAISNPAITNTAKQNQ